MDRELIGSMNQSTIIDVDREIASYLNSIRTTVTRDKELGYINKLLKEGVSQDEIAYALISRNGKTSFSIND
jgi:hypothetical protein